MASTSLRDSDAAQQKPLYNGSCHCGFVKYTVGLDLTKPTPAMRGAILTKCNCTICHKSGSILADPGPEPSFALLKPTEGEAALTDYTFGSHRFHHLFCPKCGIKLFVKGSFVHEGNEVHVLRINVLTLDDKADGTPMEDLRGIKIKYWDARSVKNVESSSGPADEPFEGGIW